MTEISAVVATYGDQQWADLARERAVPSLERQLPPPTEIIQAHHPRLTIGPARNAAAKAATGEWLLFLDADDELHTGFLRYMTDAVRRHDWSFSQHALFTPMVSYVRKGRPGKRMWPPGRDLRDDNYLVVGTLIQRALFEDVGGFGDYPHGFEDWSLWAKAWKHGAQIVQVHRATYLAHVNPDSEHRRMWRDRQWQVSQHERVRRDLFPELYA